MSATFVEITGGFIMNGNYKTIKRELFFLFLFSYSATFWAVVLLILFQFMG